MSQFHAALALAVGLAWSAPLPAAGPDGPARPLPREIVAAWEKAGAAADRWARPGQFGSLELCDAREPRDGDVPAFSFRGDWEARALARLPQPNQAFGLSLSGKDLTDADLKDLARMTRLQALSLSYTHVTDAGLQELTGLKDLRVLDLRATRVTDAGLGDLARANTLQALDVSETGVTDAGLKELAALQGLKSLGLAGTRITGAGLKELAGLKQLEGLDLGSLQVTAAALRELAGLERLHTLRLHGTELTGARLKELVGAAPRRITEAQCEQLVEQLGNPDRPPFEGNYVHSFPEGVDVGTLKSKQAKVAEAYEALSDNIEVALPVLVKHADDERFSYVYLSPDSGVYKKETVGGACYQLIEEHVEVYRLYVTRWANAAPRRLFFISDECGGVETWWKGRQGKPLAELQLEGVEWALRQPRPKFFESEEEWAKAKASLRDMAHDIRASRTPLVVLCYPKSLIK